MYRSTTRAIEVTVLPQFVPDQSEPDRDQFFWAYTIEIVNQGPETVQLISRNWIITDATGHTEEVCGAGVVGEQPVLQNGEAFRYTSGCPLKTPSGIMRGSYQMVTEEGVGFDVEIPAFSLDSPFVKRVLN